MQLLLMLNEQSQIPLYVQAAEQLKGLIKSGKLAAGSKLPSSRELSESLGVSRCTASKTYDELSRQGFISTRAASGTFVSSNLPKEAPGAEFQMDCSGESRLQKDRLSQFGRRILYSNEIEASDLELHPELNYDAAAEDQLPAARWRELLGKAARSADVRYNFSDPFGHRGLRKAIADYLNRSRGLQCSHEQIALFSGTQPALDLLCRVLVNPGDTVVVENPGFPGARRTFAAHGAEIVALPVDDKGMQTGSLMELARESKLAYLTPAHHAPLGMPLLAERRKQLFDWAETAGAFVVEDDFDSEYRYGERCISSLQGIDRAGCVIYMSSFWKLLCPLLRLGFMVLPPALIPIISRARSFVERDFQTIEHEALAQFIEEGHLERQIRRNRAVYARRRELLLARLYEQLGGKLRISAANSGTHMLVRFRLEHTDLELMRFAELAGLPMVSTESYYYRSCSNAEFLLPFAHLSETQIEEAVFRFADLLRAAI